jgi:hypothetical protein
VISEKAWGGKGAPDIAGEPNHRFRAFILRTLRSSPGTRDLLSFEMVLPEK